MATRGRRYLSVTLETLLDDPQLLRHAPAPTATGVYHLETLNLETILMNSHKVSFAEPHRLWQAVLTGGVPLIRTLRAGGAYTALVTGGFTCFAEAVARDCGFDEMRGNVLLIDGDCLSGKVGEPILGPESKLAALRELAGRHGLNMAATAAVGDGANDLAMVRAAGLGAAYRGKPVLREAAGFRIDHGDLTALLYLQGYRRAEFEF